MAKFQMIDSTNPLTIAEVYADVDVNSFRNDKNWYEIVEEEEMVAKPVKVNKQLKTDKD
jgi:hypothetical protein